MTRSCLRLCFWIALVVVTVDSVCSAAENDAMIHIRKAATTSTTTTTPARSECPPISDRTLYKLCLSETFPELPGDAFVFSNDNKALVCRSYFCAAALGDFARNVRTDCTIVGNKTNVSVNANEIQQLATSCGAAATPKTTSATTIAPTPTAALATTKPTTKQPEEQASDGDRTLMFVGIAAGAAALLVCGLIGLANGDGDKTAGGDAVCCSLNLCCN
jgi:hypothetical protein